MDQRFTRMIRRREEVSADLIHALLNSVYGMFAIEAIGFGRGLGVLDASSTRLKQMYMINPADISAEDEKEIIRLFERIRDRDVLDTKEELQDPGRRELTGRYWSPSDADISMTRSESPFCPCREPAIQCCKEV